MQSSSTVVGWRNDTRLRLLYHPLWGRQFMYRDGSEPVQLMKLSTPASSLSCNNFQHLVLSLGRSTLRLVVVKLPKLPIWRYPVDVEVAVVKGYQDEIPSRSETLWICNTQSGHFKDLALAPPSPTSYMRIPSLHEHPNAADLLAFS